MRWLIIIAALVAREGVFAQPALHIDLGAGHVVAGQSENDVVLENHTGLPIVRIEIGDRRLEDGGGIGTGKILVSISPHRHHMRVVFRGGADVNFPHFDFHGVHEITFVREANKIEARIQ